MGHHITQDWLQTLQDRAAGIRKYPKPNMINELQRLLGLYIIAENLFHGRQKYLFLCINCFAMANRQNRFWFEHQSHVMHSKNANKARHSYAN